MASLHPSHVTRFTFDASTYDNICVNCGATDEVPGGWGELAKPCPSPDQPFKTEDEYWDHRKLQEEKRTRNEPC